MQIYSIYVLIYIKFWIDNKYVITEYNKIDIWSGNNNGL